MLSFRLFGFPVRIEVMFWVLCVLLGMPFLQQQGPDGLGKFVILTAVVLGSIIWHELGHAWARKRFGSPYSEITLHGFGGLCSGPGHFTRHESVLIAAAGPAASLLLGGVTCLLIFTPGIANDWVSFFVVQMRWVNIGWAIFNLLPILPLDGGHILDGLVPDRRRGIVPRIGFILAVILAALGVASGMLWTAAICGMLAYRNWQAIQRLGGRY